MTTTGSKGCDFMTLTECLHQERGRNKSRNGNSKWEDVGKLVEDKERHFSNIGIYGCKPGDFLSSHDKENRNKRADA